MEIAHAGYALATIGITLCRLCRHPGGVARKPRRGHVQIPSLGGALLYSIRLITAICAMLPPLLSGLGLSDMLTWRVSSLLIGFPALAMLLKAPSEWRRNSDMPIRARLWVQIGLGLVINAALICNAASWPVPPDGGPVMLAVSWTLLGFFPPFAGSVSFSLAARRRDKPGTSFHAIRLRAKPVSRLTF